jgi:hypothetical protein
MSCPEHYGEAMTRDTQALERDPIWDELIRLEPLGDLWIRDFEIARFGAQLREENPGRRICVWRNLDGSLDAEID